MTFSTPIIKAILLATAIFWTIIITEDFQTEMFPFILLSIIPISICCALTIYITIVPFFIFNKYNNIETYKRYFPFYAIICFSICFYGIWKSGFNVFSISFFVSAFFTTMQTWTWIVKENISIETQLNQILK